MEQRIHSIFAVNRLALVEMQSQGFDKLKIDTVIKMLNDMEDKLK